MLEIIHDISLTDLNMASQDRHRSGGVAPFHGLDQTQMLLMRGDPARRIVQTVGAALEHDALKYMAQCVAQRFIAG